MHLSMLIQVVYVLSKSFVCQSCPNDYVRFPLRIRKNISTKPKVPMYSRHHTWSNQHLPSIGLLELFEVLKELYRLLQIRKKPTNISLWKIRKRTFSRFLLQYKDNRQLQNISTNMISLANNFPWNLITK